MEVKLSLSKEAANVKCALRQPTNHKDCSNFLSWTSCALFACWGAKHSKDYVRSFVAHMQACGTEQHWWCLLHSLAEKLISGLSDFKQYLLPTALKSSMCHSLASAIQMEKG